MKQTSLISLLFVAIQTIASAQMFEDISDVRAYQTGIRANLGYFHSRIQNSPTVKSGQFLQGGNGLTFGFNYNRLPISIDADFFFTKFDSSQFVQKLQLTDTVYFRGGCFALNLNLLPKSKYIYPYVGIGYQFSKLASISEIININTASWIWKTGIHFICSTKWSGKVEYYKNFPSEIKGEGSSFFNWRFNTIEKMNTMQMFSITISYNFISND